MVGVLKHFKDLHVVYVCIIPLILWSPFGFNIGTFNSVTAKWEEGTAFDGCWMQSLTGFSLVVGFYMINSEWFS